MRLAREGCGIDLHCKRRRRERGVALKGRQTKTTTSATSAEGAVETSLVGLPIYRVTLLY